MVELENDVILDDRDLSIGRRLNDANKMGYPVVVVVGKEVSLNVYGAASGQAFSLLVLLLTTIVHFGFTGDDDRTKVRSIL